MANNKNNKPKKQPAKKKRKARKKTKKPVPHPNRLTAEQQDAMFKAWCEKQSILYVATKVHVSRTTVRRYRAKDNWDKRFAEVDAKAKKAADYDAAKARKHNLKLLNQCKLSFGSNLVGTTIMPCPNCGTQVRVPVPQITPKGLRDIVPIMQLERQILEEGGIEDKPKLIRHAVSPPPDKLLKKRKPPPEKT